MSKENPRWKRHLTKVLTVLLLFMVCLSILQWFIIIVLFGFGTEMLKDAMIRQAPEGVEHEYIIETLERVKSAAQWIPLSFLTGKIKIRKLKTAGDFAIEANEDETWTADEINSLLTMLNASVGYKQVE